MTSASDELGRLLAEFEHTAYRLELLPAYNVPSEAAALASFTAGRPPSIDPVQVSWLDQVRAAADTGKLMQRVHVVEEPLSDYLRFEIWVYGLSQAAGEDIRILPAERAPAAVTAAVDYWLFDSHVLINMEYGSQGRFTGISPVREPAAIVAACHAKDAALHLAIPLSQYIERRRSRR